MESITSGSNAVAGPGKLRAANLLLLLTLTPVWVVCLVLHSIMVFGDGPSTPPFVMSFEDSPDGAPVIGAHAVVPLRFSAGATTGSDNGGLNQRLDDLATCLIVPLHFKSGSHGFLCLGDKRSSDVYTQTDVSLLTAIAVQAS